jgi:hypothetical protein
VVGKLEHAKIIKFLAKKAILINLKEKALCKFKGSLKACRLPYTFLHQKALLLILSQTKELFLALD